MSRLQPISSALRVGLIALSVSAAAFALACVSLALPRGAGRISPVWLPNAFLLATLLLSSRRKWARLAAAGAVGELVASLAFGDPPLLSGVLAVCNTLQFVGTAVVLLATLGRTPDMWRASNLLRYAAVVGLGAAASAGLGEGLIGALGGEPSWGSYATWTMADFAGLVIVTPCLVTVWVERGRWRDLISRRGWPLVLLVVVSPVIFLQDRYPLTFAILGLLQLVTWRLRLWGAAIGVLCTLAIAAACTVAEHGFVAAINGSLTERMLVLQGFLAICFYATVPVAAQLARARQLRAALTASLAETQAAEARYRLIAERARDIIVRADLDGRITYISPACRAYGYEPEELIGATVHNLIHPDDLERYVENSLQLVRDGVADHQRDRQHRYRCKDGSYVWLEGSPTVVTAEAGEPVEVVNVFRDVTQRRAAEAELAAKDAQLEMLTNYAPDLLVEIDDADRIVYASPASRNFGYEPDELVGRSRLDFLHPDDLARLAASAAAHRADHDLVAEERQYRVRRKDGSWAWAEGSLSLVRNARGEAVRGVSLIRDISERRAMSEALEASEARYRTLADNVTDILVRFGPDGLIRYISPACRALGADPEAAVGKPVLKVIAPDYLEQSQAIMSALFSGAEIDPASRRAHRVITKDDREVWLEGSPTLVRDQTGAVVEVITVLRDISARMKMEAALADSEARFRLFAENATDLIVQSGLDGRIAYVSPACLQVTGYRPEEIVGRIPLDGIHPDDRDALRATFLAQVNGDGKAPCAPVEFRIRAKDGREVWIEARPQAVVDAGTGKVVSVTDVARDITEHKMLEEQLRAARVEAEVAANAKADFLANMSHELRTPLTSVVGFTKLALEQPGIDALTRSYVERVNDASRALLSAVNDILDFSKLEAGQITFRPEPVRVADLARTALDLFQPQAGAKDLELRLENFVPDDVAFLLDPDRMRQVLLNLMGNAVKFTETGSVTLRLSHDEAAGQLQVAVKDTGPGIPEDKIDRLFKRFSQVDGSLTRTGGTGLGLAICKGIVEALGGEVAVTSKLGEGSCFAFHVPVQRVAYVEQEARQRDPVAFGGVRVLVADDHPANRELVSLILAGVGAQVAQAGDGVAAADMAAELPYDVILMDLRMPRLDGEGALARIRSRPGPNDATPILAFTADANETLRARVLARGFQGLVAKPIAPAELISAIADAMAFEDAAIEVADAS